MNEKRSFKDSHAIDCNGKILDLGRPRVMGILNLTPDSFHDKSRIRGKSEAIKQADKMIMEGASILDLGAISTRPGAKPVSAEEEIKRLLTAFREIRKSFPEIILSIDTYRPSVCKVFFDEGADMINDISGGTFSEDMLQTVANTDLPYVIMHIHGSPENMQDHPVYDDICADIKSFFQKQINILNQLGHNKIILDPGFGFGKTLQHNYILLQSLKTFSELGYPVLVGISRKSMINKVLNTKPSAALNGTTVLNTLALIKGASILRVHDVKEAMESILLVEEFGRYD